MTLARRQVQHGWSSSRPENGDGHFPNDCVLSEDGSEMTVRVERPDLDPAGDRKEGRNYVPLILVSDECGNTVVVEGAAHVP